MRFRFLTSAISAALVAGAVAVCGWTLGVAAPTSGSLLADKSPSAMPVDTELVLAVDVSYSMDPEEQKLQREGYIEAITSRDFMEALRSGMHAKIAMTYFEWAGPFDQKIIVPWRLIDGPESRRRFRHRDRARALSARLAHLDLRRAAVRRAAVRRQRLSTACAASSTFPATAPTTAARWSCRCATSVVATGITINGLPIMLKRPNTFTMDIDNLDIYYEDCVIGGPGAFVIPIHEREQFKEAIRTKLVLEIAGRTPERRVVPAQAQSAAHFLHHRRTDVAATLGELAARCV